MIYGIRAKDQGKRVVWCYDSKRDATLHLKKLRQLEKNISADKRQKCVTTFKSPLFVINNINESCYNIHVLKKYQYYEWANGLVHIICDDICIINQKEVNIDRKWISCRCM